MTPFNPAQRHTPGARITIALYRISQAVNHMLRERGQSRQLSAAQIQALLFLKYARPGVRTIGGLADRLAIRYPTATGVADALERKGLVQRRPLEEDQRTVTLALTAAGEAEVATVEDVLNIIQETIEALPPSDRAAMERATQAIIRRLQAAGHVRVYEMCWGCQFFRRDAHPDDPRGPHHCAYIDAPLPEANTYLECPDHVPLHPSLYPAKGGDA